MPVPRATEATRQGPFPGLLITVGPNIGPRSLTTLLPTLPCGPAAPLWAECNSQCPLNIPALAAVTDTCQPLVPASSNRMRGALCEPS